jgi:diguanylate cyclase (GGDEF)-like protein/PAS domain S-box-containing protein
MNQDDDTYRTLLESTKAIPWAIDWSTKRFTYMGGQIESVLGWPHDSWASVNDWVERIHPDDRESVVNFCIVQSQAGIDHEADYRALTKDEGYVWIRDVVHVVRKQGVVESLVGFMFDINDRKKNEEALAAMRKEMADLPLQDGLTGAANRRIFNFTLDKEWARARRNLQPLSLILLDIDYFKEYNNHCGQILGDDCLRSVGRALAASPARATDCFARYAGSELALVLPDTDLEAAVQVAEKYRNLVIKQNLPHERSKTSRVVTASFGVNTVTPTADAGPLEFIATVDKLLCQAREKGGNRVEYAAS